jgi:hypothetical protein
VIRTSKDQQNAIYDQQKRFDELVEQYPYLEEACNFGIDIQMLIDNADRTPAERIRRHQAALNAFNMIRGARKS